MLNDVLDTEGFRQMKCIAHRVHREPWLRKILKGADVKALNFESSKRERKRTARGRDLYISEGRLHQVQHRKRKPGPN